MIIKPRVRGFICVTAHPDGCAANVQEQIDYVKAQGPISGGPKNVLIIGASMGYGLATRIVSTFGCGSSTLGVFFDRPSEKGRTATAGWYNSVAFEKKARAEGHWAKSINGDAFSHEIKARAVKLIKEELGSVDLVIYSMASPVRVNPDTGEMVRSVLKAIGEPFTQKGINTDKAEIVETTVEPATEEEIANTCYVMGGEDWELWMNALAEGGVLAEGATSIAYSYIGPEITWDIYKNGTIGRAKENLYASARKIDQQMQATGGRAHASVNKAVVTQASSAIPIVPLYNSIMLKVMKEKGVDEGCIEQIYRLYKTKLFENGSLDLDEEGRIRIDDLELRDDVQAAIREIWPQVTTENLDELTDFAGYKSEFLRLFGFGIDGVDYEKDVDPVVEFED